MYDPRPAMEWVLVTDPEPERCGVKRGPRSKTRCELPPDHVVGRGVGQPRWEPFHIGRSPAGHWYSWAPEVVG